MTDRAVLLRDRTCAWLTILVIATSAMRMSKSTLDFRITIPPYSVRTSWKTFLVRDKAPELTSEIWSNVGDWAVESNHGLHPKDGPRDGKQYTSKSASRKGKARRIAE